MTRFITFINAYTVFVFQFDKLSIGVVSDFVIGASLLELARES